MSHVPKHVRCRSCIAALIVAYTAAWAVSPLITHNSLSDLDLYFWPSAEIAAHGHPLLIYSAQGLAQYPNANGPLGIFPLTPIAVVANVLGWANDLPLRAGLTDGVFALFALLLAAAAVRIINHARGAVEWRLAAPCIFLLTPVLWISVVDYGHVEQPIELAFVLLAVRSFIVGRSDLTGVALGLAIMTRTTALLYVIPFALLPLAARRVKPAVIILAATVITAFVGFIPFYVADRADVVHSLITYRSELRIAGGSLWLIAWNTSWASLVQHLDACVILVVVAALCGAVLYFRPRAVTTIAGLCGLLTIAAACFPMLAKTAFPYYDLEPYVFGALWWVARPGSALNWRVVVPLLVVADSLLLKQGAGLPFTGLGLLVGVVSSAILAGVIALVTGDLLLQGGQPIERPHKLGGVAT